MTRVTRQVKALYEMCAMALVESRANLDGADDVGFDIDLPLFTVGRAGELASIHPQTLRQYDRQGLIVPQRTEGGARRYSLRDIDRLAQAQHLSQDEGINLSGIARILDLQEENRQLRREVKRLDKPEGSSIFAADTEGGITEIQRSRQARLWRHEIHVRTRELTAGYEAMAASDDDDWDVAVPAGFGDSTDSVDPAHAAEYNGSDRQDHVLDVGEHSHSGHSVPRPAEQEIIDGTLSSDASGKQPNNGNKRRSILDSKSMVLWSRYLD